MIELEILEMQGTDPADYISHLSGAQISRMTGAQISRLSGHQISIMTGDQISHLSGDQISHLSGHQISCMTGAQISRLKLLLESVPVLDKPYTALLNATKNCSVNFDMRAWHCGTAHCVAGWIVVLAGDEASKLESRFDTPTAARLILRKSTPAGWPLPNFYANNEAAAAFMRKMAALEAELPSSV